MLKRLSRYGALATKVRAIWGSRLTREDFARLLEMKSVQELAQFLKSHPGYAPGLTAVDAKTVRRMELENALRAYVLRQYLRLFHYVSREDAPLLRYPVVRAEMEQVMAFMRVASAGRSGEYTFRLPPFFNRHSRIKYAALSQAATYDQMLEAVRETEFYPALLRLRREDGGFPPYILVENAMRSYYFRALLDLIRARTAGESQRILLDLSGLLVDRINVAATLRILRFFPALRGDAASYRLPVTYKLDAAFLHTLAQAADAESAKRLLGETAYGRYFRSAEGLGINDTFSEIFWDMARRVLTGLPGIHTPLAYIMLREIELQNLIHVIECVRYGVPSAQGWAYLTGFARNS